MVVLHRLRDGRHVGTAGPLEPEGKRGQRCDRLTLDNPVDIFV